MALETNRAGAKNNSWTAAQDALDQAAERLGLDDGMRLVLRVPKRELQVDFPVTMDNGNVQTFTGYRVHHNINRGPASGGVRYTKDLTLDLVRAQAMLNSWKAALVEIPYGGAAGGVVVNPRRLSRHEREGLTRRYTTEISPFMGPVSDIPTPDVNTGSQTMAWMMDTYSMHVGQTSAGVVSGKPLEIGGTRGRREATSRGAFRTIAACARAIDLPLDGATVVIQGFGRVGSILAEMLCGAGCRMIALADDRDAVANPAGIEIDRAVGWVREHDAIAGLPDTEPIARDDIFAVDCDILVSAGLQAQITASNAGGIRAKIVAEAANAPTTPEGHAILRENQVRVIPDILCTAGGMVLGYFEWVQDIQSFFWTDAEISGQLDRIMDEAFANVSAMSEQRNVDLRAAAMMVAVSRVAEATQLRGLYP
ncbi:MAG TPA: Glu/Leu/Phe/Val dehydrogenase [Candidatus Limnocylindria bacterium]|nr:Glu/Leu/Phe/Val dehydrogenase [Candidatus Limnocylindria bacterium]